MCLACVHGSCVKIDRSIFNQLLQDSVFSFPFEDWEQVFAVMAFVLFLSFLQTSFIELHFRNWHAAYNRERIKEHVERSRRLDAVDSESVGYMTLVHPTSESIV